ncbi:MULTISPECIES: hypothetical protein [Bacillaceae]|uniref:Uncharacterized protein n=1 Tax=Lentibacillus salicampi TaxID=175306 RepID=A0A4Y9A9W7_9BACI|nr:MULTISPECIES: hypothetical protein [Bacillaceae]TFJ90646.1 hypothetical protein E4U82_19205 [Lentibacillus salicampi]
MKLPFDFSVSVGGKYYMTERSFLIILDNFAFELGANSLEEVNDYLKENFTKNIKSSFAIVEITGAEYKIALDKPFTDTLAKQIRSLFA